MLSVKAVKKKNKVTKRDWQRLVLCVPVIVKILIFNYFTLIGIVVAFQKFIPRKGFFNSPFVGLKNFEFFFKSGAAQTIITNTLVMNTIFIISSLVFSILIALFMTEVKNKKMLKIIQSCVFVPYFISWVLAGNILSSVLALDGPVNSILGWLGVNPINFYYEAKYWYVILPLVNIWKGAGVGGIIYFANILSIDKELFEAAALDGAGRSRQIIHIIMPEMSSMILVLTIMAIGNIIRSDFGIFFFVTKNSPYVLPVTETIDTYVYKLVRITPNLELSAAASLFQSLVGLVLVLGSNLIVRKINKNAALF